jgi:hypothetical protein
MNKTDQATKNRSKLIQLIKSRLSSSGKMKSTDGNGNTIYVDCDIFSNDMLNDFLTLSLSGFNQTPYFTFFDYDDADFVTTFAEVLVEGAVLQALASKSLIERGREFQINDGGLTFDPPSLSDLMQTQYATLIGHHFDKLKNIKSDIKTFGPFKKKK